MGRSIGWPNFAVLTATAQLAHFRGRPYSFLPALAGPPDQHDSHGARELCNEVRDDILPSSAAISVIVDEFLGNLGS